jgi:hypothetical protein
VSPIREFQSTTATSAASIYHNVAQLLDRPARATSKSTRSCVFCATSRCNPLHMYWFMGSASCAKCGRCGSAAAGTLPAQACGNDYDEDGHGSHVAGAPVATSLPDLSTRHLLFPPRNYRGLHKLGRRFDAQRFSEQRRSGRVCTGHCSSWRTALLPGAT